MINRSISWLPPETEIWLAMDRHPLRLLTQKAAFDEENWSSADAAEVLEKYDEVTARGWPSATNGSHQLLLQDAFARGEIDTGGRLLNVGCGTGAEARIIPPQFFERTFAVDLSAAMLRNALDVPRRIQADAHKLPFPNGAFSCALLVNMFLFPREIDRLLAPGGRLIWISTGGERTPIFLGPDDVLDALPGEWSAKASLARCRHVVCVQACRRVRPEDKTPYRVALHKLT